MSTAQVLSPTNHIMATTPIQIPIASSDPVDESGVLRMDKVLKNGWLLKRTRKTKGWKRRWFVLRPDRLSCYKDQREYKIHRQIYLGDVTAVAIMKNAKKPNVFGVFLSSKTFYFQGESAAETRDWVEKLRTAAAIADGDDERSATSPIIQSEPKFPATSHTPETRLGSSSSELGTSPVAANFRTFGMGRMSTQTLDYSGPEVGSMSSISDGARISQLSLVVADTTLQSGSEAPRPSSDPPRAPKMQRNESGLSQNDQLGYPRVIWHGYLYRLASRGGVKQWRKYWIVVRSTNIGFYKNQEEYRAIKILPLENVVDAVEIDPLSKSKKHCLQIITEGKSFRFAAKDEEILANSLGAMKSALAKKAAVPTPGSPAQQAATSPATIVGSPIPTTPTPTAPIPPPSREKKQS